MECRALEFQFKKGSAGFPLHSEYLRKALDVLEIYHKDNANDSKINLVSHRLELTDTLFNTEFLIGKSSRFFIVALVQIESDGFSMLEHVSLVVASKLSFPELTLPACTSVALPFPFTSTTGRERAGGLWSRRPIEKTSSSINQFKNSSSGELELFHLESMVVDEGEPTGSSDATEKQTIATGYWGNSSLCANASESECWRNLSLSTSPETDVSKETSKKARS
ncbi:hypothetical protein Tco_0066935 [Tanacetum coccineum]